MNYETIEIGCNRFDVCFCACRVRISTTSRFVSVQITINENGEVESALGISDPLLRTAAVEAAKEAKFSPTLLSGNPVKVTGVIVYNFVAPDENDK
ncbi:MAG: energy transducer TonB [Pyrinomonadaceae bacterium]